MLSDKDLTDYAYLVSARFENINSHYIELMGQQIREIGQLSPSNLHRLEQMTKMSQNVNEINQMLADECGKTVAELQEVYRISGMDIYADASKYYMHNGVQQIAFKDNKWMQDYLKSMNRLTQGTFSNLANTTSVQNNYRQLVDVAIDSVASGTDSYSAVIRQLVQTSQEGMRVNYASGITRRLDSAVRMNVLDGLRQYNNSVREYVGHEFGANGVEVSAHALCALDHIDIQGRQFALGDRDLMVDGELYESFNKINDSLDREISTLNCRHITFPIILGLSEPTYTDEELDAYKENSNETFDINGREVTKYQVTQLMRKMETAMRYAKDEYIAGASADDYDTMLKADKKLKFYQQNYKDICDKTGLEPHLERAYVPKYGKAQQKPKPVTFKAKNAPTGNADNSAISQFMTVSLNEDVKTIQQELIADVGGSNIYSNEKTLDYISKAGAIVKSDLKSEFDKHLLKSSEYERNTVNPLRATYNSAYSDVYGVMDKEKGWTIDEFDKKHKMVLDKIDAVKRMEIGMAKATSDSDREFYKFFLSSEKSILDSEYAYSKYKTEWDKLSDAYNDFKNAEQKLLEMKNIKVADSIDITKGVLSKYRNIGYDAKDVTSHLNNSRSPMRKIVEEAYQCYPSEWVEGSISAGNLSVKKVDRGYYNHYQGILAISDHGREGQSLTTAIHELGHRYERTQDIVKLEKMLYDKRCKNEPLQWLGGNYARSEQSRFDSWVNNYIGKDYNGTAYEVVSMGFQYAFTDIGLLMQDDEYANFILGVLAMF